jgi:serine/threonine-protein kinase
MGLFDRQQPQGKRSRPKVLAGLDDNSPHLLIDNGNGAVTIMDRETFDYLYGESSAPDPAQRDLDELLPRISRVRAIASSMFRGRAMGSEVVIDTADPAALAALRQALRIVEDPSTFTHSACLGGPTLELYHGPELVAAIGLQHGHSIRWNQWKHDARLGNGQALTDWLLSHGFDQEFLDVLLHNQYDAGGMMPLGFQRRGPAPLSRGEQRIRLAEISRIRGGDLDNALARCQEVIDAEPGLAYAYAIRALIRARRGEQAGCVADCSEAIRLGLRDAELFFARAVAHDFLGQTEKAIGDCTTVLQIEPRHANAWNSRGLIRGRLGQLQEALGDFTEAIRFSRDWFLPYLHRAQAHHGLGQLEAAIADYNQALELMKKLPPGEAGSSVAGQFPKDDRVMLAGILCLRAQAHFQKGDVARTEADFEEALSHDRATALEVRGRLRLHQGAPDRALEDFTQLIGLRPDDASGYFDQGQAHLGLENWEQAIASFTRAIQLAPGSAAGYALRAQTQYRQGRLEEALADITRAIELQPGDLRGYCLRAAIFAQQGAYERQLRDLEAALQIDPENPLVCNSLAWLFATCPQAQFRDAARALEYARLACEKTGWQNHHFLDTLAAACAAAGHFAHACHWEEKVVAMVGESEGRASYQARLALYRAGQPYREPGGA